MIKLANCVKPLFQFAGQFAFLYHVACVTPSISLNVLLSKQFVWLPFWLFDAHHYRRKKS